MNMRKLLNKEYIRELFKTYWVFLLSVGLIIVDQITKIAFQNYLKDVPFQYVEIIPGLFRWQLVYNEGAAWSMFEGNRLFLGGISFLASLALAIAIVYYAKKSKILVISLSVILAGAAGNGIDRIFNDGRVIDFIYFNFFLPFGRIFPIFNFADMCITVGGFFLVIYIIYTDIKETRNKKNHIKEENHE